MSTVMIKCPNKGEFFSTGIETDENSFSMLPDVPTRSRCPVCGVEHVWWKQEARLSDAIQLDAAGNRVA
jgi:hypothetical protein